jgi:hypothetical protein
MSKFDLYTSNTEHARVTGRPVQHMQTETKAMIGTEETLH